MPYETVKPPWLKRRIPAVSAWEELRNRLSENRIHTVCQEAACPNIWECFSEKTATFLILGDRCTRSCRFCAVSSGLAGPPDTGEPDRVAEAAREMRLDYVVVTSVTRDDLPDGGAAHFAETIKRLHETIPGVRVEVLIPDFQGDPDALHVVLEAQPAVVNHNIETVSRLYDRVRPEADYARSLELLARAAAFSPEIKTKSGLMLGIGETDDEILRTLKEIRATGCRLLTLGQYLSPSRSHLPVDRYIPPAAFDRWRSIALDIGFDRVASGPFVRSSYHARELARQVPGRKI